MTNAHTIRLRSWGRWLVLCVLPWLLTGLAWAAGAGGHGGEGGGHGDGEHEEHGSWIQFLYTFHIIPEQIPDAVTISILTAIGLGVAAFLMTRNLERIPSKRQAALELIVSGLERFVTDLVGPRGKKYLPLVGTLFLYILFMNLSGLIPGWKSPTANLNVTVPLALCVFLFVQYEGIRANGLFGYLKHFWGEPVWLGPLNFPIHVIGELARPLSLSIRLFGNIFGEDMVIIVLVGLGLSLVGSLPIPIQAPMYFFGVFTSFVQALVFSILTSAYIAGATAHEGHDEHEHGEHAEHHGGHGHAAATA
jgi:F-type H+-transporting ATPase subunit a